MKKYFHALVFLGIVFALFFYVGKKWRPSRVQEGEARAFSASIYPMINHSFVILIVGYNNGAWVEKTLESACRQNYSNFRIVYIDDGSEDGSFELVKDLAQENSLVTLVHNEKKLGVLANYLQAISSFEPDDIVVVLKGEDWLAHEWVLSRLNQYYANPDLWITYGQSRLYPTYTMGNAKEFDRTLKVRSQPFSAGPLHSFYANLFQQIAEEDLGFFAGAELAYMLPMLEMADGHAVFVPEIFYIENQLGSKEDGELEARCVKAIRKLSAYAPLMKRRLEEM